MNKKVAQSGSKFILGAVIAGVLGMIVKLEHHLADKIDDHYDQKDEKDPDS